ncbi:MAG: hypothetical protein O3A51_02685 [Verrucomicrobia bacterium]|nr:hypothetical protein [Verrucomicrobiota bacterium]
MPQQVHRFKFISLVAAWFMIGSYAMAQKDTASLITAHNMWFENANRMYAINYKKGRLIPAGTAVSNVRVTKKTVTFDIAEWNMTFVVNFQAKFQPNVSIDDLRARLFTTKTKKALLAGFSRDELAAIEAGQVRKGMSKAAVLVAYGYPPEHRTPSTNLNDWIYWLDRYRTRTVQFDANGKTLNDVVN